MKARGLYVALILLCALTGLLYWSNHHKPADESVKTSADTPPKILSVNEADLTKVDLHKKQADQLALVRGSSGEWEIVAPRPMTADQSAVTSMLGNLSSLNADRLIDEKGADLNKYGLQDPSLELDLTTKQNKSQRLLIGDSTPAGSGVYAMLAGDPRVFTIASYTKTGLDKSADDLRDKRLLTLDPDKVSQLEVVKKNLNFEFGRDKENWQILKPKPARADSSQVGELLSKLSQARMESPGDDQKNSASAFASAAPVAKVKLTGDSGVQQLELRKNKQDFYAKSSVVSGVYKVSSDVGQALDKNLDDFRNKKLFDFGFDDPNKVEIRDGSNQYVIGRNGENWVSGDSKKIDSSAVQSLLGNLRGLSATKFADSGFRDPNITVVVTSSDGKRVEKVQIAPSGKDFLARREGDSTLYQLDSTAVSDLQKAAADLKAAAPAKK